MGSVVDNAIYSNHMAGVAIGRGGASHVTGNVIRDGNGGSLCVSAHSRALISSNVIHHHAHSAMQVPEGLLAEVLEHNVICDAPDGDVVMRETADELSPPAAAHLSARANAIASVVAMRVPA